MSSFGSLIYHLVDGFPGFFHVALKGFILLEKKSLFSFWLILVTLFLICSYAASNKSDWFFTAAFFVLSLTFESLLSSELYQGVYLSATLRIFKGACFSLVLLIVISTIL